jgi:electron transfer flavoprotein alpha subunit
MNPPGGSGILILVEHHRGRVAPVTRELVACARAMQKAGPKEAAVAILGDGIENLAQEIAAAEGLSVYAVQGPGLADYSAEAYRQALMPLLEEIRPTYVCMAHTSQGLDLAPGLAARLQAACITGVERVTVEEGELLFSRPLFNGKLQAEIFPETETTVLTVAAGAFSPPEAGPGVGGRVERRPFPGAAAATRVLGQKLARQQDRALGQAEVIVAAGRGIGGQQNLALIERLAALFPRSAVAGSRPVCDQGWLPYANQVGMTGATVAPRLYLACGISGSRQHTVGMAGSQFIVAISTDPDAAIFDLADIGIVEDLTRFVPVLLAAGRAPRRF